eukprot:76328-Amphidinium_carterae.1
MYPHTAWTGQPLTTKTRGPPLWLLPCELAAVRGHVSPVRMTGCRTLLRGHPRETQARRVTTHP